MKQLEVEKTKLENLVASGADYMQILTQSCVVDKLIVLEYAPGGSGNG